MRSTLLLTMSSNVPLTVPFLSTLYFKVPYILLNYTCLEVFFSHCSHVYLFLSFLKVILQHHDQIVTASDMGLSVACQYDLTNKSVSNEVDLGVVGDLKHSMTQESIVDSPNVAMRVTDRRGEATAAAQVNTI